MPHCACRTVHAALTALCMPQVIGIFLNRLSDWLFVAARLDALGAGGTEQAYKIQWRVDRWQRQVV